MAALDHRPPRSAVAAIETNLTIISAVVGGIALGVGIHEAATPGALGFDSHLFTRVGCGFLIVGLLNGLVGPWFALPSLRPRSGKQS